VRPLLAPLVLLLAAAPSRAQAPEEQGPRYADSILAIVEGEPITRHDLEVACRLTGKDYFKVPTAQRDQFQRDVLERLIQLRIVLAKAKEQKLALTPQDEERVQREVARMAENFRGLEGLRQAIEQMFHVPFERYVANHRDMVLESKVILAAVSRDIYVSPAEIRRHYEKHQKEYQRSGETRLRHLILYPRVDDGLRLPPAVKARAALGWDAAKVAAELRKKVLAGELAFEDAQREWSMGPNHDGEEVYAADRPLAESLLDPLPQTVEALRVGAVSEPVEAGGALHLLLLVDRVPTRVLPLGEVQEEIELTLKEKIWQERRRAWMTRARAEAHVELFLPAPN
jgi:parvulin-like peptidyl-prolyl isomerase